MKCRLIAIALVAVFLMGASGTSFNAANYSGTYTSGASAAASGVISTGPALLTGCEIYNGAASAQSYMFFDSATVPPDGTGGWDSSHTNGWKVFVAKCAASSTCYWTPGGPNSSIVGGSGVVFANGISWSNSSTFPAKTIGSADSSVACTYWR